MEDKVGATKTSPYFNIILITKREKGIAIMKNMRQIKTFVAALIGITAMLMAPLAASATDIDLTDLYNAAGAANAQAEFKILSRDIGRAIYLNPGNSPEPLKLLGVNAGFELSYIQIDEDVLGNASGINDPAPFIIAPKLRVQKGITKTIDIGLAYLPPLTEVNVGMYGGEIRWDMINLLPIPIPLSHLSLRGSYTKLTQLEELDLSTTAFDLSLGLNLPVIKPYAGVGLLTIDSKPGGLGAALFSNETTTETVSFVGAKLNIIPFFPINIEYMKNPDTAYSIRFGFEF